MAKTFRDILEENEKKTKMVIGCFIFLYCMIGLLVDIIFLSYTYHKPFLTVFHALITFKKIPVFTLVLFVIAWLSVIIAFKFHDNIMLMGSEYHEINPDEGGLSIEEKQLYNIIEELKISSGFKYMPKIYIIEADYMNAFASGYSEKSSMVAITRGLMDKLNRAEIQAVMAHELSHIKHLDIKLMLTISVLSNIMLWVVDNVVEFFFRFGSSSRDREGGGNARMVALIIMFVLRLVLPIITLILTQFLSRTREYMADAGAVKMTRDNEALANALKKIHDDYGQNEYEDHHGEVRKAAYIFNPFKGVSDDWFSTHPSLENRLKALGVK